MFLRRKLATVLSLLVGSSIALAQGTTPSRTLVRAGHLLEVKTGKLLDAQTIVVTGDTISSVAATSSVTAQAGDKVIDLGGMTVMPGLIDVHTHITGVPNFDPYFELTQTDAKEAIQGVANARTTLLAGAHNTLPLDINAAMTQRVQPTIFALGTASTIFSLLMIGLFIVIYTILYRRSR